MQLEVPMKHLERYFKRAIGSITLQFFACWLTDLRKHVLSISLVKEEVNSFLQVKEMGIEKSDDLEKVFREFKVKMTKNKNKTVLQRLGL